MWLSNLISARIVMLFVTLSASLLITGISTVAQTNSPSEASPAVSGAASVPERTSPAETRRSESGSEVMDRVNVLEESLRVQNAKLEAMEKVIAEQQRMINALLDESANSRPSNANAAHPSASTAAGPQPEAQAQTPSLDDRLKKVEGQVAKAGPFRLSGD